MHSNGIAGGFARMSFDTDRTIVACGVGFVICMSLAGAVLAAGLMLLYDARVAATQRAEWTRSDVASHRLCGAGSRSTRSRLKRLKGIMRLPLNLLSQNVVTRE